MFTNLLEVQFWVITCFWSGGERENGATESTAANFINQLGPPFEVKAWTQKKIIV